VGPGANFEPFEGREYFLELMPTDQAQPGLLEGFARVESIQGQ